MPWCTDVPEDETISLFAGLLANPDVRLSQWLKRNSEDLCGQPLDHLDDLLEVVQRPTGDVWVILCFVEGKGVFYHCNTSRKIRVVWILGLGVERNA